MTTLPGPDERIAELTRVLRDMADVVHSNYHRKRDGATPEVCSRALCILATSALAGDYVKDGGR